MGELFSHGQGPLATVTNMAELQNLTPASHIDSTHLLLHKPLCGVTFNLELMTKFKCYPLCATFSGSPRAPGKKPEEAGGEGELAVGRSTCLLQCYNWRRIREKMAVLWFFSPGHVL